MRRRLLPIVALALAVCAPLRTQAQAAADPAAQQIEAFDASLLDTMKQAKSLSVERRYQKLEPVIERTFDLPTMTRFAVGPTWSTIPAADQAALIKAFGRLTIANYVHNFDSYSGERFAVENVDTRGADKLVHSRLTMTSSGAVTLVYRMRAAAGTWKIIDVYFNGAISSLTGQRSEFAATLQSGGAGALVKAINGKADKLLKP